MFVTLKHSPLPVVLRSVLGRGTSSVIFHEKPGSCFAVNNGHLRKIRQ